MTRVDPASLRISQVNKSFDHEGRRLEVLRDIDFAVEAGEFIAIVGASGCGKSTLLRLLAGLDRPDTGTISIAGKPITGPGLNRGLVFQDHRLFPWLTVAENIDLGLRGTALGAAERRERVADLIRLVRLDGFANAKPQQISGGMAQRTAIARALAAEPQVLLMDEPFGALDALTRVYLQAELQRIWQERQLTVVLVTHDIREAVLLADRVFVMEPRPGRIEQILAVDLRHPRNRTDPRVREIEDRLLDFFHQPA